MFTVIFADKEIIKLFEETKMFFGPLLDPEKVAFCEWDENAKTLDLMVPKLYETIEFKGEWRAIILKNDGYHKQNPFNYTDYKEPYYEGGRKDLDYYSDIRAKRFSSYEKATFNPMVKLTTALCSEVNYKNIISSNEAYQALISGEMTMYEYMLKSQLEALNCAEVAGKIEKYQRDVMKKYVKEEDIDSLISHIKGANVKGIIELIPGVEILEFIQYIGNDPIYYDPEYTECLIENTKKSELLRSVSAYFSMKDRLPSEVICLSPRTFDFETIEQDVKWQNKDERTYSRFADFNLYNEKLKFILFDIMPSDNRQYKFDQIKLMCLLLLIADNELPQGLINGSRVYRAGIDFDIETITKLCEKYLGKLKATKIALRETEIQLDHDNDVKVDDAMARRLFESNISIPVKVNSEFQPPDFFADYKPIGLSADCPEDEELFWSNQYRAINKKFTRYIREPKRSLKYAISNGFNKNRVIDDDRALLLTDTQVEDVKFHLDEEEQKMIEATTKHIFDTKKFTEQMQDADKKIRKGISQRMKKKVTVGVSLCALIAYLIGFLPLIFTNLNTVNSFLFSLAIIGGAALVFLVVGFIYLFILRNRLIELFKNFNHEMSSICLTITSSLGKFSNYLSCACNVMRDFSVLKRRESSVMRAKRVVAYHNVRIDEQIANVHRMFSKYVDFNYINTNDVDPYEYDFTMMREYSYEMPSIYSKKRIIFLQQGNEITVPIDYVESVTLAREELYD